MVSTKAQQAVAAAAAQCKANSALAWVPGKGMPVRYTGPGGVQTASGLGYSATYLAVNGHYMPTSATHPCTPTLVAAGRKAGQSWGYLMVATNSSEAAVRNAFAQATGVQSLGLRNGNGGRYLNGNAKLYQGNNRALGSEVPVGTPKAKAVPTGTKRKVPVVANTTGNQPAPAKAKAKATK